MRYVIGFLEAAFLARYASSAGHLEGPTCWVWAFAVCAGWWCFGSFWGFPCVMLSCAFDADWVLITVGVRRLGSDRRLFLFIFLPVNFDAFNELHLIDLC